jgi:ATP-dependent protease ClpP protease subunit
MTLRTLPELVRPSVPSCSIQLSDRAVKAWSPIQAPTAAVDEDTISILDVIGYDFWTGDGVTAKRISAALRSIGDKPVTVQINSPGGDFFEGVTIYNMLRAHPARVTVQILGIAASAASVIAMAADRIEMAKLGFMMIHNTQWVASGDRHSMKETHDIMEVFDQAAAEVYADRTGKGVKEIAAMLDAETWFSGQGALDGGFADALLDIDVEAAGARNEASPLYRVEALLAAGKPVPRAERRKLMKEITDSTPGAAFGDAMPGAGDHAADDDGGAHLSLALARLRLARA